MLEDTGRQKKKSLPALVSSEGKDLPSTASATPAAPGKPGPKQGKGRPKQKEAKQQASTQRISTSITKEREEEALSIPSFEPLLKYEKTPASEI